MPGAIADVVVGARADTAVPVVSHGAHAPGSAARRPPPHALIVDVDEKSRWAEFQDKVSAAVLGALAALNRAGVEPFLWTVFTLLVDFFQLVAFPLREEAATRLAFSDKYVGWAARFAGAWNYSASGSAGNAPFFVATGFTLATPALFGLTIAARATGARWERAATVAARVMASVTTGVAFVPTMTVFADAFQCGAGLDRAFTDDGCVVGSGAPLAAAAVVLGATAFCTALVATFTCAQLTGTLNSARSSWQQAGDADGAAVATTRADIAHLVSRAALSIAFVLLFRRPALLLCVAGAAAVLSTGAQLVYVPYLHTGWTRFRTALLGVFAWTVACVAACEITGTGSTGGEAAWLVYYCGLPFALLLPQAGVKARRATVSGTDVSALTLASDVELKARCYMDLAREESLRSGAPRDKARKEVADKARVALGWFDEGGARFPRSGAVLVARAAFCTDTLGNRHLAMAALNEADRLGLPPDLAFHVHLLRTDGGANAYSGRDAEVARYISFQRHYTEATAANRRATSLHVSFFRELLRAQPDLGRVRSISLGIRNAAADAMEHYQAAVNLSGSNPLLLAEYASFVSEIVNNLQFGGAIEARARETRMARATGRGQPVKGSAFDDRNGVVMVSASDDGDHFVGEIMSCTNTAAEIFGHGSAGSSLVGRNISMLIPAPLSGVHDNLIRGAMRRGAGEATGADRNVLGLHADGTLVSIHLRVQSITGVETVNIPAFLGVISPVDLDGHYLLVRRHNGTVAHCTPGVFDEFHVTREDVAAGDVTVSDLAPGFHSSTHVAATAAGVACPRGDGSAVRAWASPTSLGLGEAYNGPEDSCYIVRLRPEAATLSAEESRDSLVAVARRKSSAVSGMGGHAAAAAAATAAHEQAMRARREDAAARELMTPGCPFGGDKTGLPNPHAGAAPAPASQASPRVRAHVKLEGSAIRAAEAAAEQRVAARQRAAAATDGADSDDGSGDDGDGNAKRRSGHVWWDPSFEPASPRSDGAASDDAEKRRRMRRRGTAGMPRHAAAAHGDEEKARAEDSDDAPAPAEPESPRSDDDGRRRHKKKHKKHKKHKKKHRRDRSPGRGGDSSPRAAVVSTPEMAGPPAGPAAAAAAKVPDGAVASPKSDGASSTGESRYFREMNELLVSGNAGQTSRSALRSVWRAIVLTMGVVAMLAVSSYIVMSANLSVWKSDITTAAQGVNSGAYLASSAIDTYKAAVAARGTNLSRIFDRDTYAASLTASAEQLVELSRNIGVPGAGYSVDLASLSRGGVETVMYDQPAALLLTASKLRIAAVNNFSSLVPNENHAVFHVLANSYADLADVADDLSQDLVEHANDNMQRALDWQLAMGVAAVTLTVVACGCVVIPTILRVESKETGVLALFVEVPRESLVRLLKSRADRLRVLAGAEAAGDPAVALARNAVVDAQAEERREETEQRRRERAARRRARAKAKESGKSGGGGEGGDGEAGAKPRVAKRRCRLNVSLFLKVVLLALVSATYFVTTSLWTHSQLDAHLVAGNRVKVASSRGLECFHVMWATYNTLFHSPAADIHFDASAGPDLILEEIGHVTAKHEALLTGDESLGVGPSVPDGSAQHDLVFGDACVPPAVDRPACEAFADGLMLHGINAALGSLFGTMRGVRDLIAREQEDTGEAELSQAFQAEVAARDDFVEAEELQRVYLNEANLYSVELYERESEEAVSALLVDLLITLIAFVLLLLVLYVAVYRRTLQALTDDILSTHSILLIFPPDTLAEVEGIRAFVEDEFSAKGEL